MRISKKAILVILVLIGAIVILSLMGIIDFSSFSIAENPDIPLPGAGGSSGSELPPLPSPSP